MNLPTILALMAILRFIVPVGVSGSLGGGNGGGIGTLGILIDRGIDDRLRLADFNSSSVGGTKVVNVLRLLTLRWICCSENLAYITSLF